MKFLNYMHPQHATCHFQFSVFDQLILRVCVKCRVFALIMYCCRYEPEVFPGVIFSMKEPKVTVLIFVSGRFAFLSSPFQCLMLLTDAAILIRSHPPESYSQVPRATLILTLPSKTCPTPQPIPHHLCCRLHVTSSSCTRCCSSLESIRFSTNFSRKEVSICNFAFMHKFKHYSTIRRRTGVRNRSSHHRLAVWTPLMNSIF